MAVFISFSLKALKDSGVVQGCTLGADSSLIQSGVKPDVLHHTKMFMSRKCSVALEQITAEKKTRHVSGSGA